MSRTNAIRASTIHDEVGSMAEEDSMLVRVATDRGSLSAGGAHSAAISTKGVLYTWGSNEFGQLGRELDLDGDNGELPDWENDLDGVFEGFHPLVEAYMNRGWQALQRKDEGAKALGRPTKLWHCGTLPKPVTFFLESSLRVLKVIALLMRCTDTHTHKPAHTCTSTRGAFREGVHAHALHVG